jgi:hypothetical protein
MLEMQEGNQKGEGEKCGQSEKIARLPAFLGIAEILSEPFGLAQLAEI